MADLTLVKLCISKVVQHIEVLQNHISDLPASLLKDLLPHLNILDLDRVEQIVRRKGISTAAIWASKWRSLSATWRFKLKLKPSVEEDWKQRYLESHFHTRLLSKHVLHPGYQPDLLLSANHVQVLSLFRPRDFRRLVSEDMRSVLSVLEKVVRTLRLVDVKSIGESTQAEFFSALHRLLDHGLVTELHLKMGDPSILSWITSRCMSPSRTRMSSSDEGPTAFKLPRLQQATDQMDPREFQPPRCMDSACPEGQIHSLRLEVWSLKEVIQLIPTWTRLRSFYLYVYSLIWEQEVVQLLDSFRTLFLKPDCSLKELSLVNVCLGAQLLRFLTFCPALKDLVLEITVPPDCGSSCSQKLNPNTRVDLERLTLKAVDSQIKIDFPAVLHVAPKLSSLHITRIQHTHMLLYSLAESSPLLTVLKLEDVNLSNSHHELLHLLHSSTVLEELCLKDCRLLERCKVKTDFLLSFVAAIKKLSSLRSLSLAQNRLATSVMEVAELFSGQNPTKITTLDLSSNFILPGNLLEFSRRIEAHHPAERFTLNLCYNPLDRDPELKGQALQKLLPFCHILTDQWNSRSQMADHVSVM